MHCAKSIVKNSIVMVTDIMCTVYSDLVFHRNRLCEKILTSQLENKITHHFFEHLFKYLVLFNP